VPEAAATEDAIIPAMPDQEGATSETDDIDMPQLDAEAPSEEPIPEE